MNNTIPVLQRVEPIVDSAGGKTSINMENLMKMKEEYIFAMSGFNEKYVTSIEVFDVSRGIWRNFDFEGGETSIGNRTKS
jgi:hypothetical protein